MALRKKDDKPPEGEKAQLSLNDDQFEDSQTAQGQQNAEEDPPAETINTGANGLKAALKEQEDEDKKKADEAPAVDPNHWVIKIYEGGNVRDAVVGQPPLPNTKEKSAASNPTPQKKAGPQKTQKTNTPKSPSV